MSLENPLANIPLNHSDIKSCYALLLEYYKMFI